MLRANNRHNLLFHIHVISTQISESTKVSLIDIGYVKSSFLFFEGNEFIPSHYSFKTSSYSAAIQLWLSGLEIVKKDKNFIGHISRETISDKFIVRYSEKKSKNFILARPFPLTILKTVDTLHDPYKKADLHVKRSISTKVNYVDSILVEKGFSEVWTKDNRLYTIQIESVEDAKKIFKLLKQYFDEVGGIDQLSFEIVNEVIKFPHDLKMTEVLPTGTVVQ